jgi:hypothetical protein
MILKRATYTTLTATIAGLLFYSCAPLKGWFVDSANKSARQLTEENISTDKNMDIRFDVWASNINKKSYVSGPTDSIDVSLSIHVFRNQSYIFAPQLIVDELTLIDTDKNDTLQLAYIRCSYSKNLRAFSEITPAFQEWARSDSLKAAKEGFWREEGYYGRTYSLDFRMNKQLKDVKNLLLNFRLTINDRQYSFTDCRYNVKERRTWILPH